MVGFEAASASGLALKLKWMRFVARKNMVQQTKHFGQKEVYEAIRAEKTVKMADPLQEKHYLEHRKTPPRARQFKNVQIVFNNGFCTLDAILRDISEDGARIETKHVLEIPNDFTLKFIHDNITKKCSLVWRGKTLIGVRFLPS